MSKMEAPDSPTEMDKAFLEWRDGQSKDEWAKFDLAAAKLGFVAAFSSSLMERRVAQGDAHRCFICNEPFQAGQMVLPDVNEGLGHRECFGEDREGYVKDTDTGEPLGPDDPIPAGEAYDPADYAPPPVLTFAHLRRANAARQLEWDAGGKLDLAYRGNEFAGEAGEVCNVIKKLERERLGIRGSRDTVEHLAEELADAVMTADLIANHVGIDLAAAIVAKFNATSEANGIPVRLTTAPAGGGYDTQGVKREQILWCPDVCPLTGRPFFMWIDGEPTYGGPFDSYTIPTRDAEGEYSCRRYDHDDGAWKDWTEGLAIKVVSENDWLGLEARAEASLAAVRAEMPETWMLEPAAIYLEMVDDDETGSNVIVANFLRVLAAGENGR